MLFQLRREKVKLSAISELFYYAKQLNKERALRAKGIHFRSTDPDTVKSAYKKMSQEDFEILNSRQQWLNWIVLGRALSGRLKNRQMNCIDIGCATGTSTEVLAAYLPMGSSLLAYDLSASFVKFAKKRIPRPGQTSVSHFEVLYPRCHREIQKGRMETRSFLLL